MEPTLRGRGGGSCSPPRGAHIEGQGRLRLRASVNVQGEALGRAPVLRGGALRRGVGVKSQANMLIAMVPESRAMNLVTRYEILISD